MNRTRLNSQLTWLRAQPGDGIARFDHLNSVPRNRPPAHPTMGVPTRSLSPTPAWVWDPHRPGWRMTVTDPAATDLRPVQRGGHPHQAA